MNILDVVMNSGNGAAVRQLGTQFGLSEAQVASALSALVPALAGGVQRNVQSPDGLAGLTSALASGKHKRYVEEPDAMAELSTAATAPVRAITATAWRPGQRRLAAATAADRPAAAVR